TTENLIKQREEDEQNEDVGEVDENDENDADEDDDDDDEMMHALSVQFNPGHHGIPGCGQDRGRRMPFSSAGHSLSRGSGQTTAAPGDHIGGLLLHSDL
ncbi:hypothetical protein BG006_002557, partial [Podila minutissima]